MESLPTELLIKIFQQLPPSDLHKSFSVCKTWYEVAIPIRYRHIILANNHQEVFSNILIKRANGHTPSLYVRKLTFSYEHDKSQIFTADQFYGLIKSLTHLEKIQFEVMSSYSLYLEYLHDIPLTSLPCIKSIRLHKAYLPIHTPSFLFFHICVAIRFREYISSLSLDCKTFLSPNTVFRQLCSIENLKELEIWNRTPDGYYGLNMMSMLYSCPQLTRLQVHSEFDDEDIVLPYQQAVYCPSPVRNISLKELTLNVFDLTTANIKYILRNLNPTTLEFDLQITRSSLVQWIAKVDPAVFQQFIVFLKNTKQFKLHIADRGQRVPHAFQPTDALMPAWKFIHSLYNPQYTYHLIFYFTCSQTRIAHLIEYDSQRKRLVVSLYVPSDFMDWQQLMCVDHDNHGQTSTPLNTLYANSIKITRIEEEADVLKSAFDHLKTIIIMYPTPCIYYICDQSTLFIGPLESKNVSPSRYYKSFVNNLKPRNIPYTLPEYLALTDFSVENSFLEYLGCVYSQIRKIVFKKCRFTDCRLSQNNNHRYNVDLQRFESLDSVEIDLDCLVKGTKSKLVCLELIQNTKMNPVTYYIRSLSGNNLLRTIIPLGNDEFVETEKLLNTLIISLRCNQLVDILLQSNLGPKPIMLYIPIKDRNIYSSFESLLIR